MCFSSAFEFKKYMGFSIRKNIEKPVSFSKNTEYNVQ